MADLSALAADGKAISAAGLWLNPQSLDKVTAELATAVAAGTDTTQAKTDFAALFTGSSVSQATIDAAFTDLVKAIKDSGVTSAQLATIAADQAAVQADLSSHGTGSGSDHSGDCVPTPPATTGGTTTTTPTQGSTTSPGTPAPITPIPLSTATTTPTVPTVSTPAATPTTSSATTVSTTSSPTTVSTAAHDHGHDREHASPDHDREHADHDRQHHHAHDHGTEPRDAHDDHRRASTKVSHAHAGTNRKFHVVRHHAKK